MEKRNRGGGKEEQKEGGERAYTSFANTSCTTFARHRLLTTAFDLVPRNVNMTSTNLRMGLHARIKPYPEYER